MLHLYIIITLYVRLCIYACVCVCLRVFMSLRHRCAMSQAGNIGTTAPKYQGHTMLWGGLKNITYTQGRTFLIDLYGGVQKFCIGRPVPFLLTANFD